MPILFAPDPPGGAATAAKAFAKVIAHLYPGATPAPVLRLSPPHEVYELGANDVMAGHGLAAARPSHFRYLIENGTAAVAAAEVRIVPGAPNVLALINFGRYVASSAATLDALAARPEVAQANYEARLLRCAAAYCLAIWLKPEVVGDDIFCPLPSKPGDTSLGPLLDANGFFAMLIPILKIRLQPPAGVASPA